MTPVLQSRRDGTGDCVRSCIAALLNLQIAQVPDFTGREDADRIVEIDDPENPGQRVESGYPTWYMALQHWLAGKGYFFLEIQLSKKTWNPIPFEAFAIFIGDRESEAGLCRHAIVGKCEGESFLPIFDPMGTNPLAAFKDGHIDAVCFLVPINPATQVMLGKAVDSTLRLARQLPWSELKETIIAVCSESLGVPTVTLPTRPDPSAERGRIITRDENSGNGKIILPP